MFNLQVRVYLEDTDAGGIVFYANYLKFMERARSEFLHSLGIEVQDLPAQDVQFVVRDLQIDYRRPARLGDELLVSAQVIEKGPASLIFRQDVVNRGVLLCSARVRLACLQASTLKPRALPDFFTCLSVLEP